METMMEDVRSELKEVRDSLHSVKTLQAVQTARHESLEAQMRDIADRTKEMQSTQQKILQRLEGGRLARAFVAGSVSVAAAGTAVWKYFNGG